MSKATPVPITMTNDSAATLQQALLAAERKTATSDRRETAKRFSARFIREISTSLSLDEISVVLQVEPIRERGLAVARSRQLPAARTLIAEAREQVDGAALSEQARAAALTFQTAAESYLYYLDGMYDAAIDSLVRSIDLCRVLSDDFGQEMEFRKIHLGCNMLRVRAFTEPDAALLVDHVALIAYIEGDRDSWPVPNCACWRTRRPLQPWERVWNLEEVLANISFLLDRSPDMALRTFEAALAPLARSEGLPLAAFHWCHAIHAAACNVQPPLLPHALGFFRAEDGALPVARKALVKRLVEAGLIPDVTP